jgi:predicted GIY-YIG superfamily endonuclease
VAASQKQALPRSRPKKIPAFSSFSPARTLMFYVYILISQTDKNRYYIGITKDLKRRLKEHNQAKAGYSKRYAPWEIGTYIFIGDEELAYKFEKYLKSGSGHAFLKKHLLP